MKIINEFTTQFAFTVSLIVYMLYLSVIPEEHKHSHIRHIAFVEKDASLSFPLMSDQVTHNQNIIICTLIPIAILAMIYFKKIADNAKNIGNDIFWLCVGLLQSLLGTMIVYNTIKVATGYPRPDFFAYCNYQYYNDAIISKNYTIYDSLTQYGHFGDIKHCMASHKDIIYGLQSFPSGHASLAFASMVYASQLIYYMINGQKSKSKNPYKPWFSFSGLLSLIPIILAMWISWTRIEDYKHRPIDVFVGTVIGTLISCLSWQNINYYRRKGNHRLAWLSNSYLFDEDDNDGYPPTEISPLI